MVVVGARRAGMVAVVLAALTMGLAFAHTLELPQKLDYDAATWTQLQHSLCRYFAVIGGWRPSSPLWCSRCGPASVEQHLAGGGGWLLGAADPGPGREHARHGSCGGASEPVDIQACLARGSAHHRKFHCGSSAVLSWAYASGQRKHRLDAPPAAF